MSEVPLAVPPGEEAVPARTRNRVLRALDERLGIDALDYPVPIHSRGLAYGLGGVTLGVVALLILSGLYLSQFYKPGQAAAHQSVAHIISAVTLGRFVRGFHYWGAMAAIVFVALHALRVFVTGAYKKPREFTWLLGVALLGIMVLFLLSGTTLKWDQEAMEALDHLGEVGSLLGPLGFFFSDSWGAPLLLRFFALHVVILPLAFVLLVTWHLLLVKRHKMAPTPFYKGSLPEPTESFVHHLRRLSVYTAALAVVLAVLAALATPGLGPVPVEGMEVTKPPLPLLWLYGAENLAGGVTGILWASIALAAALIVVPFVDRGPEIRPSQRRSLMIAAGIVIGLLVGLSLYAYLGPTEQHLEVSLLQSLREVLHA